MHSNSNSLKVLKHMYDTPDYYTRNKHDAEIQHKYGLSYNQITNAIANLMRYGYIESVRSREGDGREALYAVTRRGVEALNNVCQEQPNENEQPNKNKYDFSDVEKLENYPVLFAKLMDLIISTPEFKNDVYLIIKILTHLKNTKWFDKTFDGKYPVREDAIKGYSAYMQDEGRKILAKYGYNPTNDSKKLMNSMDIYKSNMELYKRNMEVYNKMMELVNTFGF